MKHIALFVFRDTEGRILLQHRSADAKRAPNLWAFFGGGIKDGETPEQAVVREAREELSINIVDYTLFGKYKTIRDEDMYIFVAPLPCSVEQLRQQQKEGQDLGMFTLQEALLLDLIEHDISVIKELFQHV